MRIALISFGHESNTFSPVPTTIDNFRVMGGEGGLLPALAKLAAADGIEMAPILSAWAAPGGCVEKSCFEQLAGKITEGLSALWRAAPCDGVLLRLHGSMWVSDLGYGELELVRRLRAITGRECLFAASLDLHGNIPAKLVELIDIPRAYRTAPHRDAEETLLESFRLLIRCLKEDIRPCRGLVKVPLLLPGERVITEVSPGRELYAALGGIDRLPGILTSSIFVGFAWADLPDTGSSVVVAGTNRASVRNQTVLLARQCWRQRARFNFDTETCSFDEALDRAVGAGSPVFITDSGDNITAGAPGDDCSVIELLLRRKVENALVAQICDPAAFERAARAGIGAELTLRLGGTVNPGKSRAVEIKASVRAVKETGKRAALLRAGTIDILVMPVRDLFGAPSDFVPFGISPLDYRIAVFKLGYLMPELRDISPRTIMALTPGVSSLLVENFDYKRLKRPIYPLDAAMTWSPEKSLSLFD